MRDVVFANNEIYHIFNRSLDQQPIFTLKRNCQRAFLTLDFYRFKNPPLRLSKALLLEKEARKKFFNNLKLNGEKLVEIVSYCLMPNHFHFLLKQRLDNGIAKFVGNFTNSYTRYLNTKSKRVGPFFQGTFKAVRIENEEQLIHVSRYIHLNPVTSFVVKEESLELYQYSSLPEFLGLSHEEICDKEVVLNFFSSKKKYQTFIYDQIDYAKKLEMIKHLALEQLTLES